jgi:hypothetical protein
MAETNGNGGLGIPTKTVICALAGAIGVLWTYNTKLAYDSALTQARTAVVLERIDARNSIEFANVKANQRRLLERLDLVGQNILKGRENYDKTGKFVP